MITTEEWRIPELGPQNFDSPLLAFMPRSEHGFFVEEDERIVLDARLQSICDYVNRHETIPSFEMAGPRRKIFFEPSTLAAAIVTCGGVCPGLNNVIRSLVMTLAQRYGVTPIFGIRNGYQGFIAEYGWKPFMLTPESVGDIHKKGGTILGTSRGMQDAGKIVDYLEQNKIGILFVIGGDGTQRGALDIAREVEKRKLQTAVIGIPKTVDNDILYVDRSFGFATAVSVACKVIETAQNEAVSQSNGIGLVKLMGRSSGYIASLAALAGNDADFVLIPEVPFQLTGEKGFLPRLKERMIKQGHAVVIAAEGAGQDLFPSAAEDRDASGNIRFHDIGVFLKEKIEDYFKKQNIEVSLKYIDPSYIIRAVPAMPVDHVYCYLLGAHAVHAAMCGKTQMVVGLVNNHYVHIPMMLIAQGRKRVDPKGPLWLSVLEATGQPAE